ncbi:uncharacterized protein LOC115962517 [Quercus lobata]|uniref:RING-type domain-containing protein n=1 Tax=Quercus lobata TaxID=97700 RepID=A0A7N2MRF5_QUELO|nr:uncharacterized protein LOC115962517 [Quercus lobata]
MGNIQQKKGRGNTQQNGQGNLVFTCQICVKPMQSNQIFNNKNKCSHAVCKDCIAKYIQDKIDTKDKVPNIQCPGLNCNQFLDPLFCRKIIQKPRCFFMNFRCGTCFDEDNSNKREDLRRKGIQQQKRMKDNSHKRMKDNSHKGGGNWQQQQNNDFLARNCFFGEMASMGYL